MEHKHSAYRLLILLPLLLGTVGFMAVDRLSLLNAMFNCVQMYAVNFGDMPTNVLVELARWTAPLATAGGILMLLSSVNRLLRARFMTLFMDTVAVYGPEDEAEPLLAQLGRRGIRGEDRLIRARRYILLGSQEENFAFCAIHRKALEKAQICLRCDSLPAQSLSPANVRLFQPMEIAARRYWKKGGLLAAADEKGGELSIALIGFGKPGAELLYWGLQTNVFSPGQRITYHVFGDASDFLLAHPMLKEITDPIQVHEESWQESLPLLAEADLVLVLPLEEGMPQETVVYRLLSLLPEKRFTVFSAAPAILQMLDEMERLEIIDISAGGLRIPEILESELIRNAMRVNMRYVHLYEGEEETEENAVREWEKLSAFLRYSNISTADYHELRLRMLRRMGVKADGSDLTRDQLELLAELEHMRWCRYHWLNNWKYGVPENGGTKDAAGHIHADLVPYGELAESEKEKDRTTIGVLLGL